MFMINLRSLKLIALLIATPCFVKAQGGIYKTKYDKLVDFSGHNRMSGFHFAPGITYSLPPLNEKEIELYRNGDTVVNSNLKGKGKLGLYFEAGMYHLLKYGRFFKYLDWSIAYKSLKGAQEYTYSTEIESSSTMLASTAGDNAFRYRFILANVNLNNILQLGHYSFLQNSIGLNFDYALGKSDASSSALIASSTFNKTIFALHYKLGFGYKLNDRWFIIPAIETPILNIAPFEKGKSTLGVFNLRYRPLIFTIRIAWLRRPKANSCPTVDGPEGDKKRQEQYQMGR
jgi:hypothetical protein